MTEASGEGHIMGQGHGELEVSEGQRGHKPEAWIMWNRELKRAFLQEGDRSCDTVTNLHVSSHGS